MSSFKDKYVLESDRQIEGNDKKIILQPDMYSLLEVLEKGFNRVEKAIIGAGR